MKKLFVTTVLAIFAGAGWFLFTLDNRVERHIEETASILTGVPVSVGSVRISLWSGEAELKNLVVDNPKGYSDNKAFTLGSVFVKVDLISVFSEPLKIYEIKIDSTHVNLELNENLGSNLGDIVEVSNKQNGVSSSNGKKSSSSDSSGGENADSKDESSEVDNDSKNKKKSEDDSKSNPPYMFTIDNLVINKMVFSVTLKEDSWDGVVEAINLKKLGKDKGMSTRTLGITLVRELTRQVLKGSASQKIVEVVEDKAKEGVKLLESLFKQD